MGKILLRILDLRNAVFHQLSEKALRCCCVTQPFSPNLSSFYKMQYCIVSTTNGGQNYRRARSCTLNHPFHKYSQTLKQYSQTLKQKTYFISMMRLDETLVEFCLAMIIIACYVCTGKLLYLPLSNFYEKDTVEFTFYLLCCCLPRLVKAVR